MANVTYYLGAGASANALPTYKSFKVRFIEFAQLFSDNYEFPTTEQEDHYREKILGSCNELIRAFDDHHTPDLYAKKLFHQGGKKLSELKSLLILFFIHQQIPRVPRKVERDEVDKRYDNLISNMLKPIPKEVKFKGNYNIITWNYDLQFELALSKYYEKEVYETSRYIRMEPDITKGRRFEDCDKFSIVHLNGVAYCEADYIQNPFEPFESNYQLFQRLIGLFKKLDQGRISDMYYSQFLGFAWENLFDNTKFFDNSKYKEAEKIAARTEVLVIIGYSFPEFNDEIDRQIFERMGTLKKVYIQDFDKSLVEKLTRLALHPIFMNKNKVQFVDNLNSFHLPAERDKEIHEVDSNLL